MEQTEVFHKNRLRNMLEKRMRASKVVVYGELGRHEIDSFVWKRIIGLWKNLIKTNDKLSCIVFRWLNYKNEVTIWHLPIKQILIRCRSPMAEE